MKRKWRWLIGIVVAISLMLFFGIDYKKYIELRLSNKGAKMQINEWREFDVDTVEGETPSSLFGGHTEGKAILKYRLELIYPFDGKVGFFGGSDRDYVEDICFQQGKRMDKCSAKNETAYLFRSTDDGRSFTRIKFSHGIINALKVKDGRYFLNIHEVDTGRDKTYISDDYGNSWSRFGDFRVSAVWGKERFIYAVSKNPMPDTVTSYFYTKDGGKSSIKLNDTLMKLHDKAREGYLVYKNRLLFLIPDDIIVLVDIDSLEKERIKLTPPKGKRIVLYDYGVNQKSGDFYVYLENIDDNRENPQLSVWFPFENQLVEFDKSLPENETFFPVVAGDYIGGLVKIRAILTHIWTMDRGKKWQFEILPQYLFDTSFTGYGNNRIWMDAMFIVKGGKRNGSYFVLGTIKQ